MHVTAALRAEMLAAMEERALHCPTAQPLLGWRIFRVRQTEHGFMLTAPLIHNTGFEQFPAKTIEATCYEHDHPAPAPGCRCGLYATIDGTLDSLSGYLLDSAHDLDPPIYAEVACTGRVFVDHRGVRAQRLEVVRLATATSLWPDATGKGHAVAELRTRYGAEIVDVALIPPWVLANTQPHGAPPAGATVDLDALLVRLGLKAVQPDRQ
jgi:hypothetical protein